MLTSLVLLFLECFLFVFHTRGVKKKKSEINVFMLRVVRLFWEEKAETESMVSLGFFWLICLLGRCAKERNHALYFLVLAGNRLG